MKLVKRMSQAILFILLAGVLCVSCACMPCVAAENGAAGAEEQPAVTYKMMKDIVAQEVAARKALSENNFFMNDPGRQDQEIQKIIPILMRYPLPVEPEFDPKDRNARKAQALWNALNTYWSASEIRGTLINALKGVVAEDFTRKYSRLYQCKEFLEGSEGKEIVEIFETFNVGFKLLRANCDDFAKGKDFGCGADKRNPTASELLKSTGLTQLVTPQMTMSPLLQNRAHVMDKILTYCNDKKVEEYDKALVKIGDLIPPIYEAWKISKAAVGKMKGASDIAALIEADHKLFAALMFNLISEGADLKEAFSDGALRRTRDGVDVIPEIWKLDSRNSASEGPQYYSKFLRCLHWLKGQYIACTPDREKLNSTLTKIKRYYGIQFR